MKTGSSRNVAVIVALTLFAVWTLATWWLEGRIETLLRPEAVADRAIYALVANLVIGTVAAIAALRMLTRREALMRREAGFGLGTPSILRIALALALGFGFYVVQGAPSLDPIVLINAFAQVLVVSVAEVIVCWAVVGAVFEALFRPRGSWPSLIGGALVASILFGIYHFAHSAPFNTIGMVALLTAVGFVKSAFFFASRDLYATVLFHNLLGVFGVVQALAASGRLDTFQTIQVPLVVMAVVMIGVLGAADWLLLRRGSLSAGRH